MSDTFTAVYEHGLLRPLTPLVLPEHAHVQVQIVERFVEPQNLYEDRDRVYDALMGAGLILAEPSTGYLVSSPPQADMASAAAELATPGPISELIKAERAESP